MLGKHIKHACIAYRVGLIFGLLVSAATPEIGKFAYAQGSQAPQYIGFTKINVADLTRSIDFYTKIMGLKVSAVVNGPIVNETLLTRTGGGDEEALTLVHRKNSTEPVVHGNAFNNITFRTHDFEGVIKRLESAGFPITAKKQQVPSSVPYGSKMSYAFTKDPDGFTIEILQFHK